MTENKHIGKIIYALIAIALAAVLFISAAAKGLFGLDRTELGAWIKKVVSDKGITQEYESKLFDTSQVMTVDIIIPEDRWQDLLDNAIKEEYYECDVVINGETFSDIGIRAKGNTSLKTVVRDETSDRYSFKLKFDKYVEDQTCYGLDKLVLNNNIADATCMKEAVIYDMYAYLKADASLYNYARISVNGEYIGVYLALEAVEDSFLLRNYGTSSGELYKPENMDFEDGPSDKRKQGGPPEGFEGKPGDGNGKPEGFDGPPEGFEGKPGGPGGGPGGFGSSGGSDLRYTDDDLDSYSSIWKGEVGNTSKKDHKRVVKALKAISEGDVSTIEEYMDVDNLLKYMAVHEFAVNEDSLSGNMAHNYYLYESDGKLNIIPWDYNLSWGGMGNRGKGGPGSDNEQTADATDMINDAIDDSWQSTDFFDVLLENEEYNKRYHEYLQMLVDYVENGRYEALMARLHSQIDGLVETDPTAFYPYDEYEAATQMLDEVIRLRAKSIKGQLDGSIPSTSEGQKEDPEALVDGSGIDTSVMGSMNMK